MFQFHPIHVFIYCCRILIVLNNYLVHSYQDLHLGSRFHKPEAFEEIMGSLEFGSLNSLRLRYCVLVVVCLMAQWLSYMLWMKNNVQSGFRKEVKSVPLKKLFFICNGGIYQIKLKSLVYIHESIFQHAVSIYTFVFGYRLLVYRGFNFIVTHACHLGFQ